MVAEILRVVRAAPGFGPASSSQRADLAAAAARLSAKYKVPVHADHLLAIRNMEIAVAARWSGGLAKRHGKALLAQSRAGEPILALAARYKLPPTTVLRQILSGEGFGDARIREMLAAPETLPPRLAKEAQAVFEADLGSRLNADRIRAKSQAYEDGVGAYLRERGLQFKTEENLRHEHEAAPGPPLLTPDFLFTRPVTVQGRGFAPRRVVWLDAKDYAAIDSKLVMESLAKQAAKYTARFGPGAFVFSGGLMCGSKTEKLGPLLLDGSHIAPV
jgi:hypothetical protein